MGKKYQSCPLCNNPVDFSIAYPHYVCHSCMTEAVDENDKPVVFFHARFNGNGLQGYYRGNNQLIPFQGNTCFIKGVKCFVEYTVPNGIVVQPFFEEFKDELKLAPGVKESIYLGALN